MAKVTEAVKLEREKRRTMREEKLWEILATPNNKRLLSLVAIVAATGFLAQMPNKGAAEMALTVALPGIGIPLIAADAGITSWEALLAIGALSASALIIPTVIGEVAKPYEEEAWWGKLLTGSNPLTYFLAGGLNQ